MPCCCCTEDEEKQLLGVVCFHYQCGCCPIKCCDYDNDGMCWGYVCCQYQIDPCFFPRNALECCCICVPCGCIGKEFIEVTCCCNPGKETRDAYEAKKADAKAAAAAKK